MGVIGRPVQGIDNPTVRGIFLPSGFFLSQDAMTRVPLTNFGDDGLFGKQIHFRN
jgi:hypothetical protein